MTTPEETQAPTNVDRRTVQRRASLHPLMERYLDAVAPKGRQHLRDKTARFRPMAFS